MSGTEKLLPEDDLSDHVSTMLVALLRARQEELASPNESISSSMALIPNTDGKDTVVVPPVSWTERERAFERMLEEKSEQIQTLWLRVQELEQAQAQVQSRPCEE